MSRTKNRLVIITLGTAGAFLAVPLLSPIAPIAAADSGRGGVPCFGIVQQIASSPASIPQSMQTAASAFTGPNLRHRLSCLRRVPLAVCRRQRVRFWPRR
jgi:hypothetical protein